MRIRDQLIEKTRQDLRRLTENKNSPARLAGMLLYGGVLGLMFVVPIVLGAYVGRWLDTLSSGYSVRWTISLILLGIVAGGYNVFRFLQEKN